MRKILHPLLVVAVVLSLLVFSGCRRGGGRRLEYGYVAAVQVSLRDRVAPVFNKTGTVNNGERVEVLERSRNGRFVRVRSPREEEGWMEQRYLTSQAIFDSFQKMASENSTWPVQGRATVRASLNMHAEPQRDSDHLYQLKEGDKVELLRRASTQRPALITQPVADGAAPPLPVLEDWWLARSSGGHTGWVLGRIIDLDAPIEVAQYAEGQRIVACFVLNHIQDGDKSVPQYLMLLNEPRDGNPEDFNQLRVFTWNVKRDRYETAFRERKLAGMLPATIATAKFENEGELPTFTVQIKEPAGSLKSLTYKMNGVAVRKVLTPEEEAAKAAPKAAPKPPARGKSPASTIDRGTQARRPEASAQP